MNALRKIGAELRAAEDGVAGYVRALRESARKWDAIRCAFGEHADCMDAIAGDLPGLQSRMEANQAAVCDTILAEVGKELVMYEHAIVNCRGALAKARQSLFTAKSSDAAWEFPPAPVPFTTEAMEAAAAEIESAALALEKRRMALFFLTSDGSTVEPGTILRFCDAVQ